MMNRNYVCLNCFNKERNYSSKECNKCGKPLFYIDIKNKNELKNWICSENFENIFFILNNKKRKVLLKNIKLFNPTFYNKLHIINNLIKDFTNEQYNYFLIKYSVLERKDGKKSFDNKIVVIETSTVNQAKKVFIKQNIDYNKIISIDSLNKNYIVVLND